ncbi:MAG: hypothetical protein R2854_20835 [Caldilineaceae bacterium]
MQFLLGLVAGLIIGWIIEWIIDWQFWRVDPEKATGSPGNERLQADLAQARAQIAALEAQLQTTPDVSVTDHMDAAPAATEPVAAERTAPAIVTGPDDLTQIKGIGPVFAAAQRRRHHDVRPVGPGHARPAARDRAGGRMASRGAGGVDRGRPCAVSPR